MPTKSRKVLLKLGHTSEHAEQICHLLRERNPGHKFEIENGDIVATVSNPGPDWRIGLEIQLERAIDTVYGDDE